MIFFSADTILFSKTSNPKRRGTRTRFNLLKEVLPSLSCTTSLMSSRAALLPISIAASIKLYIHLDAKIEHIILNYVNNLLEIFQH
jgi:hypothetical protein